jgi:DNA-binding GntR family transcriptional regulator
MVRTVSGSPSPAVGSAAAAPVRRRLTVAAFAEQELRAMVLSGALAPGERLNEVAIAETLGTSRGPLREAIQRLASEGLLTVVSHKGAYVRTLTEQELRELYELRIAIESYAVRLGADRANADQHAQLRALLDRTRAVLDSGAESHYPPDLDMHRQLVSMAHNPALLRAMEETHARIHLARARSAFDPERARAAYDEHDRIAHHVISREGSKASQLLESHLRSSLDNAVQLLRQQQTAS